MGDRLPEDAYSYHWEDPVGSMESRYWNFVLENYISCANEIYNHCLTSQNIHHTREMIALTQNYSYDFANLIEFINIRRLGINVPRPRRNSYCAYSGTEDEIQVPLSHRTDSRRLWKTFRAEELVRKKKRGKNLRTATFIPNCRNDLITNDIGLKDDDLFKITTDLHQPIQIQPQRIQRTVQEQAWAQVIPQVPQLTVPHFHVPYTNFVHYPMGNFVTHQISQSYPGSCHSISNHSQMITDVNNDQFKEVKCTDENISSESIKNSPLVTHTGVQVELTLPESDTNQSPGVNLEETQVNLTITSPLSSDGNKCELIKSETTIDNDISHECQPTELFPPDTTSLESISSSTLTPSHLDDNVFTSPQLNDTTYSVFPEEITQDNVTMKSSYKEVLIKGLSSPIQPHLNSPVNLSSSVQPHLSSSVQNISESITKEVDQDVEGWQKVNNKRKPIYEPRTYQSNRSLSPIMEEELDNKHGRKSIFSKAIRGGKQNPADIYKNGQTIKISKEEIFKKNDSYEDDEDPSEWRNVVLKGLRKSRYDKKHACGKSSIDSAADSTFRSIEISDEKNENLNLIQTQSINNTLKSNNKNNVNIEFDRNNISVNNNEKIKRSTRKKRFAPNQCSPSVTLDNSSVDIKFSKTVEQRNYNENDSNLNPFSLLETGLSQPLNFTQNECETTNSILEYNVDEPMKRDNCDEQNIYLDSLRVDGEASKVQGVEMFLTAKTDNRLNDINDIFDENDFIIGNFDSTVIDAKTSAEELEKILKVSLGETSEEENDATKLLRETEAKQQQAHEKRLQLLQCKTARVREQVQKVEEAKAAQYKLALQRKSQIDLKLKKAEENRNQYLSIIRKKAHDEEEKLKEIAFINELEAQNRRHDSLALRQEHEERLQTLFEERQRKVEEKAAKEAAVEERRRVLEAERQEKLKQMKEKRRRKEEIIDRKQQEKEKERLVIAREKAREREERLQARQAAQLATLEELQKRIQQKQEESARRHEENIELIRQKALEIGLHRSILDDVTNYHICYKIDDAEVQGNIPKDKMKANLKRCKKIRSRLSQRGEEFVKKCSFLDAQSSNFGKVPFARHMLDLSKYCVKDLLLIESNITTIERILSEVNNNLENKVDGFGPHLFIFFKGFLILESLFEAFICLPHTKVSPFKKMFCKMCLLYNTVLKGNEDGIRFSICSNNIMKLIDTLSHFIDMMKTNPKHYSILTETILCTCELAMKRMAIFVSEMDPTLPFYRNMTNDTLSYILTCGLTSKITEVFQLAVINEGGTFINLIPKFVQFLSALLDPSFMSEDVIRTLKSSDCIGTVPLLYEGLQKMNSNNSLPLYTTPVINLLLLFAKLDISAFQETLGAEGMGLQVRAIASFLMTYCCLNNGNDEMLQAVIEIVGYFAVHNKNNQSLIQSGQQPTILQQLVSLPFKYFCDFEYKAKLFPTLVVCSYNNSTNRAIVENECSYKELELFLENPEVKKIPLLQVFFEKKDKPDI